MKKLLLIVNPISGKQTSKKLLPEAIKKLEKNFELKIIKSKCKGDIENILNTYDISKYYFCCIMGGDGSLHEAINGLLKRADNIKIPLALIPAGSGNSLARDLDILDFEKAIENIINEKKIKIDIAEINFNNQKIYSFNIIGWGMVANIGIKAEKYRWLGTSRYTILSLLEIIFKKINSAKITYYDENNKKNQLKDKFMYAVLCNTIHTGKGMKIAPKAKLNDGLMDLVLIKDAPRLKLLKLMPKLFTGEHINDNTVDYIYISKMKLEPNKLSNLNIDGEIKGETPFEINVIPSQIEIIIN